MIGNTNTSPVVLVAPPLTLEDRYGEDMKAFGAVTEPLGIAYLAGSLESINVDVIIIDAPAELLDINDVVEIVYQSNCSLVGISMLTPSFEVVKNLCDRIKRDSPEITILLGGPHCTALPERTLSEISSADILCFGEGEETIKELALNTELKSLGSILGICYRDAFGNIIKNNKRPYTKDLDLIPMPARHLLPMDKYHLTASRVADNSYCPTIIVARGCPFGCTYCSHSFGRKIRFHSIDRIIQEIKTLVEKHKISQLNIEADTLTANKHFASQLCLALIESGLSKMLKWTCESRVDTVTEELLKLMKKAGCWQISYGIETGSQRLLDMISKSITLEQVENTIRVTHRAGISVRGFFMLGLPTETKEESFQTIDFAIKLNPQWAQFTITIPYPGTPMFAELDKHNKILHYDWKEYNTWSGWKKGARIPYVADNRSLVELLDLQKFALRKYYLRPKVFFKFLFSVRSFGDIQKYFNGFIVLLKSKLA